MTETSAPPAARTESFMAQDVKPKRRTLASGLLVDAHVHCHECFEPAAMLDRAAANFEAARGEIDDRSTAGAIGCLLLAENPADDFFHELRSMKELRAAGRHSDRKHSIWRIDRLDEPCSVMCRREHVSTGADQCIIVIAGRQIVVRERLEVLALCTEKRFPIGRSLKSTLEAVLRAEAIPVIPWGFGKWLGERGELVRKVLESGFNTCVYLGDNGNRLQRWPEPRLFRLAEQNGVPILPGSDPLPLRGRERDAGGYGVFLEGEVDVNRPAQWIKRTLRRPHEGEGQRPRSFKWFGKREGLVRFCASQLAMQWKKRADR